MEKINLKEADVLLNTKVDTALAGSADYVKKGTEVALELLEILEEKGVVFSRAPDIAGSIGKQSHLGPAARPDFDMVLYVNIPDEIKNNFSRMDQVPMEEFQKVIADTIESIAKVAEDHPDIEYIDKWEVCVDVKYKNFEFDLVPAINFQKGDKRAVTAQWTTVLNLCSKNGADLPFLGPSMSDKVVWYVHGRDPTGKFVTEKENAFCRRAIVLAKIWKHNWKAISKKASHGLKKVEKMCAESTIIELVAMYAAQLEWKNGVGSLLTALETFLKIVATPRGQVKVILDTRGVDFPSDVDCSISKQLKANQARSGGILIDPVNPYLNYLDPCMYDVVDGWAELGWAATRSLDIFRYGCYCGCGKLERRMRHVVGEFRAGEREPPKY